MAKDHDLERREFLGSVAALTAASALAGETASSGMQYRRLGKTGEKVSAIGLGGSHIGDPKDSNEAIKIIRTALDRGLNFLDNCWDYHDGDSEVRMGKALRDGYRQKAFLMTKFDGRTKTAALQQIDESLKRLQTDHLDLIQFHENIRLDDPDRFFAEGGAVEAMTEARQAGKARYIGFTGHKDPLVHLRMLDEAKAHNFHFDTCQMPLNIMDASFRSFQKQVMPRLVAEGIGVLGMKPIGAGILLKSGSVTAMECLHYALSLPTSVVINGCDSMAMLDQAFEAIRTFQPLDHAKMAELEARARKDALTGKFELFKTSTHFDGTIKNPQWMG
jgi:predicted aldo/keto reductase-like oxidoreductase